MKATKLSYADNSHNKEFALVGTIGVLSPRIPALGHAQRPDIIEFTDINIGQTSIGFNSTGLIPRVDFLSMFQTLFGSWHMS